MAQVRLDEVLLNDPRFKDLVALICDEIDTISRDEAEEMAVGKCWRAFLLSQRYWRDNRQLIPLEEWSRKSCASFAKSLEAVKLARREKEGVYVCGAKDFFDWYHDKVEAGRKGGIESGKTRSKRSTASKQPKQSVEADEAETRSNEPVSVSVSVSDSVSDSVSKNTERAKALSTPDSRSSARGGKLEGGDLDPDDQALAERWADYARSVTPSIRINLAKWADAVRLLRTRDNVPRSELERMLAFIRGDDFWRDKALSLDGLRKEGRNGLRKFENIRNRMRESGEAGRDWMDAWVAEKEREIAEGKSS